MDTPKNSKCIPYKGCKEKIAKRIIDRLPAADTFVDLFCGGGAVTVAAMQSGKYKHYIINDIEPGLTHMFVDAIAGRYADATQWVSRQQFEAERRQSAFIRYVWSFANNGINYLYSREIEPWKKAMHYYVVEADATEFHTIGIYPPMPPTDKPHTMETRRQHLRRWIEQNATECMQRYTEYYLCHKIGTTQPIWHLMEQVEKEIVAERHRLHSYLRQALEQSGLTQAAVCRHLGTQMAGHYFGTSQWEFPTEEAYKRLQHIMHLPLDYGTATRHSHMLQTLQSLKSLCNVRSIDSLQGLENIQRLNRLQRLQGTATATVLTAYATDYREVELPPNAVIYCDPPYQGTNGYNVDFDHADFYCWLYANSHRLIYVSEYAMPCTFERLAVFNKRQLYNQFGSGKLKTEGVWAVRGGRAATYIEPGTQLRMDMPEAPTAADGRA